MVLSIGADRLGCEVKISACVKSPASFAEKCRRKEKKYPLNPVYELTDLCGARMVAATQDQVDRLCAFVERIFLVDRPNSEDKLSILRTSEFAYRSVHFVVQLDRARLAPLGLDPETLAKLAEKINRSKQGEDAPFLRKAEIQIRTAMQHVWAETLHDRTCKSGIVLPKPLLRESFRIAALLEKADQDLLRLSGQIDAFSKDHVVHLDNQAFERELDIARSLADQRRLQPKEKAKQVLRLLSLLASARRWGRSEE